MDDERARRVGRNENLYRQVNERIEDINEALGREAAFEIVCECGELTCFEHVTIARSVYEETRADPARFVMKPGHQMPDVETVVHDEGEFIVVEKTAPGARTVARETDPRS